MSLKYEPSLEQLAERKQVVLKWIDSFSTFAVLQNCTVEEVPKVISFQKWTHDTTFFWYSSTTDPSNVLVVSDSRRSTSNLM